MKKRKELLPVLAPNRQTPSLSARTAPAADSFWLGVAIIALTVFLLQLQLFQLTWDTEVFASEVSLAPNEMLLDDFVRNKASYRDLTDNLKFTSPGTVLTEDQVRQKLGEPPLDLSSSKTAPSSMEEQDDVLVKASGGIVTAGQAAMEGRKLRITLHVFCWKRQRSQDRLFRSLLTADYLGQKVDLHIHIDGGYPAEVLRSATALDWPHGKKTVHAREGTPLGLPEVTYPPPNVTLSPCADLLSVA